MTDIERIRQEIDDPYFSVRAWADAEEEAGNTTVARGLRAIADGKRWPRKDPGQHNDRWCWRRGYHNPKWTRGRLFAVNSGPDMMPNLAPVLSRDEVERFIRPTYGLTAALELAAVYIGTYLNRKDQEKAK